MQTLVKIATAASVGALLAFGTAGPSSAQVDCKGHQQDNCSEPGNQIAPTYKRNQQQQDNQGGQGYQDNKYNGDGQANDNQPNYKHKEAQNDWKFDSKKHHRSRHRDNDFRFEFGGYWYPQPYWLYGNDYGLYGAPGYSYGVSCVAGRNIVRNHGFYAVRTVECNGRTFTYLGRRHGDAFQVLVSSRSGRIVDVNPL